MKQTRKFAEAQKILTVKVSRQQELYDRLFAIGYSWDAKSQLWSKKSEPKNKKASPVSIRIMGEELSCRAVLSLIQERLEVSGISLRKNQVGDDVRVYAIISPRK